MDNKETPEERRARGKALYLNISIAFSQLQVDMDQKRALYGDMPACVTHWEKINRHIEAVVENLEGLQYSLDFIDQELDNSKIKH